MIATKFPSTAIVLIFGEVPNSFHHEDCEIKINLKSPENLGSEHLVISYTHLPSLSLNKYLILTAETKAGPLIMLGLQFLSKHLFLFSFVVMKLSAITFFCGVSGMIFCFEMVSELIFFFGTKMRRSSIRLGTSSPCLEIHILRFVSKNTTENPKPDISSTLKGSIISVNTLTLAGYILGPMPPLKLEFCCLGQCTNKRCILLWVLPTDCG